MNFFAPGTENFSFPLKIIYILVAQLIKAGDNLKERQNESP